MLWFKHSSDARNSLKLRKVRRKYGADGYAIYWFCLEAIAHDVDKDNLTFNLKEDAETIGFELTIQEKRVNEIMIFMVDIGLFENSNNMITCMKLAERLDKSMTNSPRMRAWLGDKGKEKVSASVMTLSDSVTESVDSVSTCAELDKTILDKTILNNKDLSSKNDDSEFLQNITDHWNNNMTTQPRINLLAKNEINKKRKSAIKKIIKDYPEYKDHLFFDGHFDQLATSPHFAWQRDNKQISFDQATNLIKFAGNLDKMKMGDTQ